MTYGLSTCVPTEDALTRQALARAEGSWGGYQAWRRLNADHRLQLVEKALKPANDLMDPYPLAL